MRARENYIDEIKALRTAISDIQRLSDALEIHDWDSPNGRIYGRYQRAMEALMMAVTELAVEADTAGWPDVQMEAYRQARADRMAA